ncbi:metal ABC transporter substrate-binding protein, partial [Staphylococcus pseudintermedius]
MMKRIFAIAILFVLLAACGINKGDESEHKLKIVTTNSILY